MIVSLQNRRVKEAAKLRRQRGRDRQQRFLIDGLPAIRRAMASNIEIREAFVCTNLLNPEAAQLAREAGQCAADTMEVSEPVWEKIAYGNRRDGLLLVAKHEIPPLQPELQNLDGLILILDRMEKPGNVGAIFRTAAATNVAAIFAVDPRVDLLNPNVIRASQGTIFQVPCFHGPAKVAIEWLSTHQRPTYVTRVDGPLSLFDVDWSTPAAVVLGSESQGVDEPWMADSFQGLHLPMNADKIDSLNVANTAAVVMYEWLRQSFAG